MDEEKQVKPVNAPIELNDKVHDHPFYGQDILVDREQIYIQSLLKKYRGRPVNDDLRKEIWDELQMEKHNGRVTVPFKIATRRDPKGKFPEYIEVILDTKV
jgi:hypothetical protein